MNVKQPPRSGNPKGLPKRKRRSRMIVARSLAPERPNRVWSLLLPPTFPAERK